MRLSRMTSTTTGFSPKPLASALEIASVQANRLRSYCPIAIAFIQSHHSNSQPCHASATHSMHSSMGPVRIAIATTPAAATRRSARREQTPTPTTGGGRPIPYTTQSFQRTHPNEAARGRRRRQQQSVVGRRSSVVGGRVGCAPRLRSQHHSRAPSTTHACRAGSSSNFANA